MEKGFIDYLESIGITAPLTDKVENAYNFYHKFLDYTIDDLFISEYLTEDGSKIYEGLWFFNSEFCFEAKSFVTQEDFDSDKIINKVRSFTLKKNEYDIIENKHNDGSRLYIEFTLDNLRTGILKASRNNCLKLRDVFFKYIHPNFKNQK